MVSSRMYATKARSYRTFTFSCFLRSSMSSETSAMPSSSSAIAVMSSFSFFPLAKGSSTRIGT